MSLDLYDLISNIISNSQTITISTPAMSLYLAQNCGHFFDLSWFAGLSGSDRMLLFLHSPKSVS
jgi:hypothetical protein